MRIFSLFTLLCCTLISLGQQSNNYWPQYNVHFSSDASSQMDVNAQATMRSSVNWQNFLAANGSWWVEFDQRSGLPRKASGTPLSVSGSDPVDMAMNVMTTDLAEFDLPVSSLNLSRLHSNEKFHFVDFVQTVSGLEILGSEATFRITPDGRMPMFGFTLYPDAVVTPSASLSPEAAVIAAAAGIPEAVEEGDVLPQLKVLPVFSEEGTLYRVVYEVHIHLEENEGIPGVFEALVDANDGSLYYRNSEVHTCAHPVMGDVDVDGTIVDNPLQPPVNRGLPYIRVEVAGTSYYADENGSVSIASITGPTSGTVFMDGLYADVSRGTSGATTSIPVSLDVGANTVTVDGVADDTEISAYYHTNIIHDYMKLRYPSYTSMDFPFTVRVDRTDGSCNAFYDGSSINFYAPGGGCPATALFSDVVYHEYGHGLNNTLYQFLGDPSGMGNGAMNEGYADLWGIAITANPILGQGFSGGSSTFVRRYDIDPVVYPEDLIGQVHNDGEIIAGAWWDYGVELGDPLGWVDLWLATYDATIDGFGGTEGFIYRDVLLEALIQDDDDGDISNGTPNDDEIITAFGIHGITLLANVEVQHTEELVGAGVPITIEADIDVDFSVYLGDVKCFWRVQGETVWNELLMSDPGGTTDYRVDLPAQPSGTILEYYFQVFDSYDQPAVVSPSSANLSSDPNLPYFTLVDYSVREKEDFDNTFGDWVVDPFGTDDATTGIFEFNTPNATLSGTQEIQPGDDHTSEGLDLGICVFTGQTAAGAGIGDNDVDDGTTSVRSPAFDATQYDDPVFSYWRWFSNGSGANPDTDPIAVHISNDGTNWVDVELSYTPDQSWRRNVVRISDYVTPSATTYLLFLASDSVLPGECPPPIDYCGSVVEAAIDDLYLWGRGVDTTGGGTGFNEAELSFNFDLYPNPANGAFTIQMETLTSSEVEVSVLDAVGRLVWSNVDFGTAIKVPDLQLPAGIYTVRARIDGEELSKQISIQ